jgi:hypothetical protein
MGFLSDLFGNGKEDTLKVRKAIIAYTSGNLIDLAFANIGSFISSFQNNPTKALKARLFSAAMTRAGVQLDQHRISDIEANFYKLDNQNSVLCFNFKEYGGLFEIQPDLPTIAPSFIAIVFNNDLIGEPAIFALEPSYEVGKTMLISLKPDLRINLGSGSENNEHPFLQLVKSKLGPFENAEETEEHNSDIVSKAENILEENFGFNLDRTPDKQSILDNFTSMSSGLSEPANISLILRLVAMNFLASAKILRDAGETFQPDDLIWLIDLVNVSQDYAEVAEDQPTLEILTSQLNKNIMTFLSSFGIHGRA